MAKILLGIALAVMLATAALGYLAKGNIDKLQGKLADTKSTLATTQTTLATTKTDLAKTKDDLTAANTKIEEKDKEIATQKGQMDDLNKKIEEATATMIAKTKEVDDLNAKIAAMTPKDPANPNSVEDPLIAGLKAEVARAQAEVAESKTLIENLGQQKRKVEEEMAVLAAYKKSREAIQMRLGTQGRVLAVNSGWSFVVVSIGDKQGAVMNATMLVVRDGTPIGKVRISSVEPTTSIADIIPGSLRRGITIQPGDSVVYEGRSTATTPPSGGAPALPAH